MAIQNTWTVLVSGPISGRTGLLTKLGRSGIADISRQPETNPSHGLDLEPVTGHLQDAKTGWVTFLCDDLEGCRELVLKAKWQQRMHWPTPRCPRCAGNGRTALGQACLECAGSGRSNIRPLPQKSASQELAELKELLASKGVI